MNNRNYNLDFDADLIMGNKKIHVINNYQSVGTMYRITLAARLHTGPVRQCNPTISLQQEFNYRSGRDGVI